MESTTGKSYDSGRSRTSAPNHRHFDRNLSNSPQRAALSAVLLALLLLAPQAAWAQVATLQSTTDGSTYYQWNILGNGSTNSSNGVTSSPTFDYGLRLYVNNTVFPTQSSATTSSVSAGGTMATLGPVTMSGLSVSRSVYAPRSSTYPWLRWTDTYTNSTSASITVPVEVRTDLWHDSNTTYSTNNLTSTSGSYIVAAPTSYQPAVLLYFRGSSGQTFSETPTISASHGTQDLITVKWNVTVPAGGTVRMVYFAAMASSATIASSIQEKLLYGFSSAHYNFSTTGSTSYSSSLSNSCGYGYKSSTAVAYSSTYFAPYTFSEIGTIKTYRTTNLYSSTINLVDTAYNSYS